jgi:hypothetical protein
MTTSVPSTLAFAASQMPLHPSDIVLLVLGVAVLLAAGILARRWLDAIAGGRSSAVAERNARRSQLSVLPQPSPSRQPSEQA